MKKRKIILVAICIALCLILSFVFLVEFNIDSRNRVDGSFFRIFFLISDRYNQAWSAAFSFLDSVGEDLDRYINYTDHLFYLGNGVYARPQMYYADLTRLVVYLPLYWLLIWLAACAAIAGGIIFVHRRKQRKRLTTA